MSLKEIINNDLKSAMKAGDKQRLEAIRAVKAAILLAEAELGKNSELSPEQEQAILKKLLKQRKTAAEIYHQQNRTDLAEVEELQSKVIETYLKNYENR